jgi:hypothetical protein
MPLQMLRQIRGELAEKKLILLEKEKELLAKDQDLLVLKEEVSKSDLLAIALASNCTC